MANNNKKAHPQYEETPISDGAEAKEEISEQPEAEAGDKAADPPGPDDLRKKYEELLDRNLRLMAEYDNFRKRSQKEKEDIYQNATAAALTKFLPVQDDFERASAFDCQSAEFQKGFSLMEKNFAEVLKSLGVEPVGCVGEAFDPLLHHAVMHIEDDCLGENVVSQVLQKGYKMGDRVLRYAMVQTAN
ncbi:MAG: nucleotide exchange factor GrpE [Oscillospiraceae bacterium]|nr:nucleotide exchange factor GrpE [Oscillospiraceae bacterium]